LELLSDTFPSIFQISIVYAFFISHTLHVATASFTQLTAMCMQSQKRFYLMLWGANFIFDFACRTWHNILIPADDLQSLHVPPPSLTRPSITAITHKNKYLHTDTMMYE
jgi:hypothetical protein